jgi:hypothetical protein
VICLIAFVTALPIDLYLLQPQVDQRLHEEQVLRQIPGLIRQWDQAQARMAGNAVTEAEIKAATVTPRDAVEMARGNRDEQARRWAQARAHTLEAARAARDLERLATASDASEAEVTRRQLQLSTARRALSAAQQEENRQAGVLRAAETRSHEAGLNLEAAVTNIRVIQMEAGADADRYANWIDDLANSPPGRYVREREPPAGGTPLLYDASQEAAAGPGDRLIALGDLLAGRSPRRPKMSDADRATLAKLKLTEFVTGDPDSVARTGQEATALRRLTWACFAVFIFLPVRLLALKGLFDRETLDYFDTEYQRQLGHSRGEPQSRRRSAGSASRRTAEGRAGRATGA